MKINRQNGGKLAASIAVKAAKIFEGGGIGRGGEENARSIESINITEVICESCV
jgi:hypothetical protein